LEIWKGSFAAELVEDILALMASFSAKIFGKRSHKDKKRKAAEASGNNVEGAQDTVVSE